MYIDFYNYKLPAQRGCTRNSPRIVLAAVRKIHYSEFRSVTPGDNIIS